MTENIAEPDHYMRRGGGDGSGNGRRDSSLSLAELSEAAGRDFFDHEGRDRIHRRIGALMYVLTGEREKIRNRLRQGAESTGLLDEIPSSEFFPVEYASAIYRNAQELRELTDAATEAEVKEHRRQKMAQEFADYREWATARLQDLTIVGESILSGIKPGEIITTDHLRMVLATEAVSQDMITSLVRNRGRLQAIMAGLKDGGQKVEAASLASTMQRIGRLCQRMQTDMERLTRLAEAATGSSKYDERRQSHSGVLTLTERARAVFRPFIGGTHIITMQQMRELDQFLGEAGGYNESIGSLIADGISVIKEAQRAGRHDEVRRIEEAIQFADHVAGFNRVTRALDHHFIIRAGVLANAGAQNRVVLESTPPAMLAPAEKASGLSRALLLRRHSRRNLGLVLPEANH